MASLWNSRTAIITGVAITLFGAFHVYQSPSSTSFTMPNSGDSSSSGVPGLNMELSQISRNPPTLLVTVKNNSPDTPYTILKWGTPVDSAALNIGVFKIVGEESGHEVKQLGLKINRKMPPPQEDLLTVAPGSEEKVEVVFDKPWMPEQKPAKYKIKAEGEFKGVWDKHNRDVRENDLEAYSDSPFSGRKFTTNEVVLEV
ncbi:hypothetical protein P153DRAFT_362753 [Dothidotthia symphoricarpi CBS 119687]|uniref:Uncharacterized protein n=1 Tax=Dothidotthia symphoricarpi CBS 119687 TaxID=1392245 RepID=A0A6A6AS40_9PLEO|nr:uncharacterized protein P153DRAFT_362753 [Dothidotthia symphoricarpi CBS 119687]KAF2133667.1 hypothetical protein P153DRAFT_362753 [Dothidotthia symphoricarpi CBS 119687]